MQKPGRPRILTEKEEKDLIEYAKLCADWGQPMSKMELQLIAKSVLLLEGRKCAYVEEKDDLPGEDWVSSFIERHKEEIKLKTGGNIKATRAAVSEDIVTTYFDNLNGTVEGVSPKAITNYDKTNLGDNPGQKRFVYKRTTKYPERIINYSKGNTSIMMAGTASGVLFPPYVIYTAQNLWTPWMENGPEKARYNTSKSGWSDSTCFGDWFFTTIVPYCKKLDAENGKCEPKVLIGDNLSSHLSPKVLQACKELNVRFVFLLKNSTHLTQPPDVVFFKPMKSAWRKILTDYKLKHCTQSTIPKNDFPLLLKTLYDEMETTSQQHLKNGFETCGIYPFSPEKVLDNMPAAKSSSTANFIDKRQQWARPY